MSEISPIMYQNQIDKLPQIQQDYNEVKSSVDKNNSLSSIFDVIPTFRRIENIPNKIEHSDYIPAAGLLSLAVLNAPEDWRDMKSAYNQFKCAATNQTFKPSYDYRIAQHPFSFFRGTLLHNFVNPSTSPCPKLAKWLFKNDTTLMDTKFGDYISKKLKIVDSNHNTKIENITSTNERPIFIKAKEFKAPNLFGELTARAMTRTTKIGTAVLGGLEAVHLAREISNGENAIKSTAKSAINLTSTIAGIGYGGAIGAKCISPIGSLMGMGVGAIAGNQIAKLID